MIFSLTASKSFIRELRLLSFQVFKSFSISSILSLYSCKDSFKDSSKASSIERFNLDSNFSFKASNLSFAKSPNNLFIFSLSDQESSKKAILFSSLSLNSLLLLFISSFIFSNTFFNVDIFSTYSLSKDDAKSSLGLLLTFSFEFDAFILDLNVSTSFNKLSKESESSFLSLSILSETILLFSSN